MNEHRCGIVLSAQCARPGDWPLTVCRASWLATFAETQWHSQTNLDADKPRFGRGARQRFPGCAIYAGANKDPTSMYRYAVVDPRTAHVRRAALRVDGTPYSVCSTDELLLNRGCRASHCCSFPRGSHGYIRPSTASTAKENAYFVESEDGFVRHPSPVNKSRLGIDNKAAGSFVCMYVLAHQARIPGTCPSYVLRTFARSIAT